MIQLTEKAMNEVKRLQEKDPTVEGAFLRVKVVGGGCSGMSYKLGFDQADPTENDKIFEQEGIQLVIDAKSFLFVDGMTIDFSDGLEGTGFVFNNPKAKRSCGCGTSFSA